MEYKQKYKNMPIDKKWLNPIKIHYFIGEVSDLAFGDEAIERGYSMEEVIERLKVFSEFSHKWEESRAEAKDLAQDYLDKKETRASCIKYFESHFKISTATANRWYNRIYDELRIPDIQEALDLKSFKDTLETELQKCINKLEDIENPDEKVELITKITKAKKELKKL